MSAAAGTAARDSADTGADAGAGAGGAAGARLLKQDPGAQRLQRRYLVQAAGKTLTAAALILAAAFLAYLLLTILRDGLHVVDWAFLTSDVSARRPGEAGVYNAMVGSINLMLVTLAFAVPVGVAAAVYLEEFASGGPVARSLQLLVENLAGVPSIVFGLLGLAIFVRLLEFGTSLIAAGLTLGLLVLPIVVVASEEALSAVPKDFRDAALAVGATRWQAVRSHVIPNAVPGILTGTILALSRAIGETAPILFMAAVYMRGVPDSLLDGFLALPIQIFYWTKFPDPAFHELAAGAIIVLLGLLLAMNSVAVAIRQWSLSRRNW